MLEVEDIALRRPGFALSAGGLRLAIGERLTVVGPSGGGKSTLLRALVGLEPRAQVRGLRWQGTDLSNAAPHRRPFGWLPQDLGLWPHMTALGHVAFARTRGRGAVPEPGDHAVLAQVGLAARATALPAELSGGERQRLAFARVIAMKPAWAVLDEPFSQLDPVMATQLADQFRDLALHHGLGLIQVCHRLHQPAGDELFWAIEAGTLTQAGRWHDFRAHPATPWISRFVALH